MEEEITTRLASQMMRTPIKSAFKLGWEIVHLNRFTILIAAAILMLLNFMIPIPFLGVITAIVSSILMISAQIYIGKLFYDATDTADFSRKIKRTNPIPLLTTYLTTAIGSYFGWMIILAIPIIFFGIVLGGSDTMIINGSIAFIPILMIWLVLTYVYPLILSNIIQANSFSEGFKATTTLFSSKTWSRVFREKYFKYIALFGLISAAGMFVLLSIVSLINGAVFDTGVIGLTISLIFSTLVLFIFMLIIAIVAILAKRIASK